MAVRPDELYEIDFYAWTRLQARELRRLRDSRVNAALDLRHLIEEVRDLGKSERDACRSEVQRVLEHLLKLACSPAEGPRAGWKRTVVEARSVLANKLTAAIERDIRRRWPQLFAVARRAAALGLEAHGEHTAAARLPNDCPFSLEDVLRDDWYPESAAGMPRAG